MWSGQDIYLDIPSPLLNYSQISVLDLLPKATNFQKRQTLSLKALCMYILESLKKNTRP